MGAQQSPAEAMQHVNEVRLVGRVGADPLVRVLPSGDEVVEVRLVVDREPSGDGRRRVDALECSVWSARAQRSARAWREGDLVDVTGSVRRRFFGTAHGRASRVSIEVSSGRRVRRPAGPSA